MEVNSEHKIMRAELGVEHLWSLQGWGRRHWTGLLPLMNQTFLWLAVVCYLPIFKSFVTAVSAAMICAVLRALRTQFAENDPGYCSCTTMRYFMRCLQLRRQFGNSDGNFLITRPSSPDLAPSGCHLFGPPTEHLIDSRLFDDTRIEREVQT
jgi:hypothetical protein